MGRQRYRIFQIFQWKQPPYQAMNVKIGNYLANPQVLWDVPKTKDVGCWEDLQFTWKIISFGMCPFFNNTFAAGQPHVGQVNFVAVQ